jgi:hypothetical protein
MKEHDLVVLTHDLPDSELRTGDIGTVVMFHEGGGYEVEFVNAAGKTLGVMTLTESAIRPMDGSEILHVRDVAPI